MFSFKTTKKKEKFHQILQNGVGWVEKNATSSNHLRKRIGENKIWCIFGTLNVLVAGGLCTNKSESFRWAPVGLTNQTSLGLE